jgi:hypothetical protein
MGRDMKFRYKRPTGKLCLGLFFGLAANIAAAGTAWGQSTPAELADLALEDLLNFEVVDVAKESDVKKAWEFAYTYRKLDVGGYKSGTTSLTFQDVLFSPGEIRTGQNYPVVPTYICQHVHAVSASYALKDNLSINIVVPYIQQATDHISSVPNFSEFVLKSEGFGDIAMGVGYQKQMGASSAFQINGGMRVPTGSIDKTGDTPRQGQGTLERLPYTMQIGSGTWDFSGAVSFSKAIGDIKLSAGANTTLRTGKNKNGYRLGNNFGTSITAQYTKNKIFKPGIRISVRDIQGIKGRDESLLVPSSFPFPASITNPANYGGSKAHLAALLKFCPTTDCDVSITGEYGKPVYQNLNGVQPKDRNYMSIAASLKF